MKLGTKVHVVLITTNGTGPRGPWQRPKELFGDLAWDLDVGKAMGVIEEHPGEDFLRTSRVVEVTPDPELGGVLVRTRNSVYRVLERT
jgi:hypothetical protein